MARQFTAEHKNLIKQFMAADGFAPLRRYAIKVLLHDLVSDDPVKRETAAFTYRGLDRVEQLFNIVSQDETL